MSSTAAGFDARYRNDPDPWGVDTRAYERTKAEETLGALPQRPLGRALEMGCGTGALTDRLAGRCEQVLAADFSPEAVRLTAERTANRDNVAIECLDLRREWPDGSFDAIVCSELLYYWTAHEVLVWLDRAERSLSAGGALVCVHWTGHDPDAPLNGPAAHALLRAETRLDPVTSTRGDGYLIDRFDAP